MPRQRLGQHFLIKVSVLDRIAHAACPERAPLVIEIGPGRGALTERLLARAERVVAVEIDRELVDFLRERFGNEPRLTVVHADAVTADLGQWGSAAIAGNLPYYAATAIIEKVLALGSLDQAVFLVQKEVAERLTAGPGSRDYGYLSVHTRFLADAKVLFDVAPSAFRPPPKVDSALVRFTPHRRDAELGVRNEKSFLAFASLCFRQKRKTIRNNLAPVYGKQALEGRAEASKRAEQLSLEQFAALYHGLVPS